MADVTGALTHEHGGRSYRLRLTLGGIAELQGKHGNDLCGLLSGGLKKGVVPPFSVMIDLLAVSLRKGEGMARDEAYDLADDMLTSDQSVFARVMLAAFPELEGNAKAPKAKS